MLSLSSLVVPPWLRIVGYLLVVAAIFGAGSTVGYKGGVYVTTKDFSDKLEEARNETLEIKGEYSLYKEEQEGKLRKIELDSRAAAVLALAKAENYRKKALDVEGKYAELLLNRKETPAKLSSSAFDTINGFVSDWGDQK